MPDYVGLIKYPLPADKYNTSYGEPQWWKDLATTAAAEAAQQASGRSPVGHTHDDRYYTRTETDAAANSWDAAITALHTAAS